MKPYIYAALLCLTASLLTSTAAPAERDRGLVYVIPIEGQIERGLVYVIRRGLQEAVRRKADAIVFQMDTPGGRLDSTKEIIRLITAVDIKTVTFVHTEALSAGAIISMATDQIFMKPGSTIGDAMPIMISPLPVGGPQAMPEDLKEKTVSSVVAEIRAAAQRKGHNVDLAEAMVRIEKEFKIDDEVICPAGELLTLTSYEAEKKYGKENKNLLSSGSVETMDELLEKINLKGAETRTLTVSNAERLARYIEMFPVSGIILGLGLLALYIEYKTPGFGVFGFTGIALLALWFWGYHIAGLAGAEEVVLFAIGVILLAVEILIIPGFGITGTAGILLIVISLLMAMVQHYPGHGWFSPPTIHFQAALTTLGTAFSLCLILSAVLARLLPESSLFSRIMLKSTTGRESGYRADCTSEGLQGQQGIAETDLHPGGIALINGRRMSVVSRGDFIDAGTKIVIAQIKGNRIVVDKLSMEITA